MEEWMRVLSPENTSAIGRGATSLDHVTARLPRVQAQERQSALDGAYFSPRPERRRPKVKFVKPRLSRAQETAEDDF